MQIHENISLQQYHTFHTKAKAQYLAAFSTIANLEMLIEKSAYTPRLILGGGSNILFTKDVNGWVLKNEIAGIELMNEDTEHVYIKVGAGENWHRFVQYAILQNWAGLENLSLIPGNVGAAPMQNIGAYGVELKEVFHTLEAFHLSEKKIYHFNKTDCDFGYRESVFKNKFRNQFVIVNVVFKLNKTPVFNTSYGAIQQELEDMQVTELSIQAISQAVINIRSSKLPDPAVTGNAGSFFKNPSVSHQHYTKLKAQFPGIVGYANTDGTVKLAAGWLIEHSGPEEAVSWKGFREGDCGVHPRQALVLVNYGNAPGEAIYQLSEAILQSVQQKFEVLLEREVNIF